MHIGAPATAVICAIAVVAAGCGRKKGAARRDAPGAATGVVGPTMHTLPPINSTGLPPEPVAVMPRELDVKLLEPGRGTRTVLRYRGGGAARELVARSLVTSHGYADGTWSDALTLAPVRDGFGITAVAAADGLTVQLRALEGGVDTDGASAAAVAAADGYIARWRGVLARRRADVTVDARGRISDAVLLDDPSGGQTDARDELVQRWLGLVVPLPEEAVAPGARWRVRTLLRSGGVVLKQTATYRLVSAGAAGWTVEVTAERIGEPQDIAVPGMAVSLGELVAMRRQVTGTLTVGPHDPLPLRGSLTAEVSTHARIRLPSGRLSERYADDAATITLGPPTPPR